jgi:transcriptional regulator of acetoin/glycerol metabolism
MEALNTYAWPGNVRELRNTIEYAFVLCKGETIELTHLPPKISLPSEADSARSTRFPRPQDQREELLEVLRQAGGNQSEAARILGVSRVTVWKRMKKYGIHSEAQSR